MDPDIVTVVVPVAAGLGGVLFGGLLTEYHTRRREAAERYDRALRALADQQASRHGAGLKIPAHLVRAVDEEDVRRIQQELSVKGVQRFIDAAAETRAALAALHPQNSDLKPYWDRFEIPEQDFDELANLLATRRRRPMRRHA